jgi:hypothetical protein
VTRTGSLRIRHSVKCAAGEAAKTKDCRLCMRSPSVLARVGGVNRSLGALPRGWRQADLIEFEHRLLEPREQVLTGRTPAPTRPVTLDEFVGPWFEKLAMQVELGRMSPLTFNKYEGDWRRHLKPAFGRLSLAAIDQQRIVMYMRMKMASGLAEFSVKNSLVPLCGMLTDAVSGGHIQTNPLRSPKQPATAAAAATTSSTSRSSANRRSTSRSARRSASSTRRRRSTATWSCSR